MKAIVGIQLESGKVILTKDLCDEICRAIPESEERIRIAFSAALDRVRKATYELGPEYH